jgi:hypothetical protein
MLIRSVADLKYAYGSYRQAALALGMTPQALHLRLGASGKLPPAKYFQQRAILEEHGHKVKPSLWGFAEADQREAAR